MNEEDDTSDYNENNFEWNTQPTINGADNDITDEENSDEESNSEEQQINDNSKTTKQC